MRLRSFQLARAVAAIAVVCIHVDMALKYVDAAGVHLPALLRFGYAGVDVFFIISGFIISMALSHSPGAWDFVWRRVIRIVPIYWLTTALWLAMLKGSHRTLPGAGELVASFLILPLRQFPALGVGWSLEHEVLFYALVAVLLIAGRIRHAQAVLAGACLVGVVVHSLQPAVLGTEPWDFHVFSLYNFDFLAGTFIFQHRKALATVHWKPCLALSLMLFVAAGWWMEKLYGGHIPTQPEGWSGLARVLSLCAAGSLLLIGLMSMEALRPELLEGSMSRGLQRIGDASYSLYLTHLLVFAVISFGLSKAHLGAAWAWPLSLASVLAAIAFAIAWYDHVELPLIDRIKRLVPSSRASQAARRDAHAADPRAASAAAASGLEADPVGALHEVNPRAAANPDAPTAKAMPMPSTAQVGAIE